MSSPEKAIHSESERESLRIAEAARQTEWTEPSFLREIFLGNFRMHLIRPYSTWLRPSPPYSVGIFMPNAPSRFNPSTTSGGYSPVASISPGLTWSRRNVLNRS